MKLFVCADLKNGLLFNGRRQSRDRCLLADMLAETGGGRLWMNGYSRGQFPDAPDLWTDEDPLSRAKGADGCFVENLDVTPYLAQADRLVLYRWDRVYPADVRLTLGGEWRLLRQGTLAGHSHEIIAKEVYTK